MADALAGKARALVDVLAEEMYWRLQNCSPEQARALVVRWSEAPGAVLLDGLDEVAEGRRGRSRQAIRAFLHSPPGRAARLVVASRTAGYVPLGDPLKDYTLKPFSGPQEEREFLKNWPGVLRPE